MRSKAILAAAGVMACVSTSTLSAQSGGIAIIPLGAFAFPSTLSTTDDPGDFEFKAKGAPAFGLEIELGLSKNLGFAVGASMTVGQSLDIDLTGGGGNIGSADISTRRFTGMLSFRPGGRRPNGAVTPIAIQLGGGLTMWHFDKFLLDTDGDGVQESYPGDNANGNEPFAFAGIAFNVPIGPRATLQLFGRAHGGFGYKSDLIDNLRANAGSTTEGKFNIQPVAGAGIRIGR